MKMFMFLLLIHFGACGQVPEDRPALDNQAFDDKLTGMLNFDVRLIGVDSLYKNLNHFRVFDTRTQEEFGVSHIPQAKYIGYNNVDLSAVKKLPKNTLIALYCSIGYRSEKVGEKLKALGYSNVFNVYGGIFEWGNRAYPVVTPQGDTTLRIHGYSKKWSRWIDNKNMKKTW